jgi:hypothetical protein
LSHAAQMRVSERSPRTHAGARLRVGGFARVVLARL